MRLTYFIESNFPKYDSNKLLSLNEMTMLNGSVQTRELKVQSARVCGDDDDDDDDDAVKGGNDSIGGGMPSS